MVAFVASAATAMADAVVAFGVKDDPRAFDAQTILASVNGWESDVLADGNRVAITQTPAGMGKFWNCQAVKGTWTNEAALTELKEFSGIELTAADLSDGTTLLAAANSNGQVAANLDLLLDAQEAGDVVTLYTTCYGWNCPLDEITVTGLTDVVINYATIDGDGFSEEPVFTQVLQGLNIIKITGILSADKHVVVTSPTRCTVGGESVTTKVGFQLAAYKVTAPVEPSKPVYTFAFGAKDDPRAFTAQTILASVNGWESDVLPDGNKVAITQTPAGMGKFWNCQAVKGTWTNEAALAELCDFSGIEFTAADLSDGTTLLAAANSNGQVAANLDFILDAQKEGDKLTFYTTCYGWNCPLDEVTVTGLENAVINYATIDGDGFSETAVFTQVLQGLNLLKVEGTLTADKHVVVTSPTRCTVGGESVTTKVGFQIASYMVEEGTGDPTAIESVEIPQNDVIYNIAGQKVGAGYKGIIIKNGRKYMVK